MNAADDRRPKLRMAPKVGIFHLGVSISSVVHLAYREHIILCMWKWLGVANWKFFSTAFSEYLSASECYGTRRHANKREIRSGLAVNEIVYTVFLFSLFCVFGNRRLDISVLLYDTVSLFLSQDDTTFSRNGRLSLHCSLSGHSFFDLKAR